MVRTLMTGNPWQPFTRAQADALRLVNAPLLAAIDRQRQAAEALTALAEQMAAMAEQVGLMAAQQTELTRQMQAALKPYQNYLDWLEGKG